MKQVDARGLMCPFPVIEAKKALKKLNEDELEVLVDNKVAVENLKRLANSLNLEFCATESDNGFIARFSGNLANKKALAAGSGDSSADYIVQVTSATMGHGNPELGKALIKSFLYALSEQDELPICIVFYNEGVMLTTEGSPVIEDLKNLEAQGVSILSCGLCLDFLGRKDLLKVGEITNMYRIVELLHSYRVIKP